MSDIFRLMLAQLNPVVGDITGNIAKAQAAWEAGREAGADMVALTEMFVTGYQTQDLILKPAFVTAAISAVEAWLLPVPMARRWGSADRFGWAGGFTTVTTCLRAGACMRGC
jgi:hypothetical protein